MTASAKPMRARTTPPATRTGLVEPTPESSAGVTAGVVQLFGAICVFGFDGVEDADDEREVCEAVDELVRELELAVAFRVGEGSLVLDVAGVRGAEVDVTDGTAVALDVGAAADGAGAVLRRAVADVEDGAGAGRVRVVVGRGGTAVVRGARDVVDVGAGDVEELDAPHPARVSEPTVPSSFVTTKIPRAEVGAVTRTVRLSPPRTCTALGVADPTSPVVRLNCSFVTWPFVSVTTVA